MMQCQVDTKVLDKSASSISKAARWNKSPPILGTYPHYCTALHNRRMQSLYKFIYNMNEETLLCNFAIILLFAAIKQNLSSCEVFITSAFLVSNILRLCLTFTEHI